MFGLENIPKRFVLCGMMFSGLVTNYMLRVNMSIAIVELVSKGTADEQLCGKNNTKINETSVDDEVREPVVDWTTFQVGWLLSAFFFGYVTFQLPGGRLAEIYGTKLIFGWTMAVCAILAFLTPPLLTTSAGFELVVVIRLLQGLCEAVAFPALNPMISKWVPEAEKSRFVSFVYSGGTFGTIFTYPLCGYILDTVGWEAVFYVTGGITIVWFILWMILVTDLPENHPSIKQRELDLILKTRNYKLVENTSEKEVPILQLIKDLLLSPPTVVLMCCEFANSWGLYTLVTLGPTFFKEVLNFDISQNGYLSALPYIGRFTGAQIFGSISGFIVAREYLRPLTMQKICVCTEFLIPAAGLVGLSFITEEPYICVAIMTIAYGFNGALYAGHSLNGLTIAPNRAGTIMGLTNGFGSIAGIFVPLVKSAIVKTPADCTELISRWRIVFIIPAVIYTTVAILFVLIGSAEVQKYDKKVYKKKFCAVY